MRSTWRSLATFTIVLLAGTALVRLLSSYVLARHGRAAPNQAAISERIRLEPGQAIRYDLVLSADGRVKVDVRAAPAPIDVKLAPTGSPDARPLFWHHNTLTVIRVESLSAGKWMMLIERSHESAPTSRSDTTVTTEVTVL